MNPSGNNFPPGLPNAQLFMHHSQDLSPDNIDEPPGGSQGETLEPKGGVGGDGYGAFEMKPSGNAF